MEVAEASITGLFRTLLIIIGAIVLLRFVGQLMNAKRNMEEERELNAKQRRMEKERQQKKKNLGKTRILGRNQKGNDAIEDVDYEEID